MKSGKQYDELSKLFAAHKTEIPDNGFSQRVAAALPERSYEPLRYMAVVIGAIITLAVAFFVGNDHVVGAVADLIVAVCTQSAPSPTSLLMYGGLIGLLSMVGFVTCYESYQLANQPLHRSPM